ncbi:MAG TPA: bifunctional riboflavin kinase/FAD synthetase [Longimicrobiales bacterium]|nr:bifunctional riboflavin kinase/FAD synthetase [Longimicrobiales bacterium]
MAAERDRHQSLAPAADGTVVTVGAFDGIHLGHRVLIDETVRRAAALDLSSVVLTFSTHPAAVLRPDSAPALLSTPEERVEAIASLGVDRLVVLPFNQAVADLTAREFVRSVLVGRLGIRHLVIGHDHALGRDRVGDAGELRRLGGEFGFDVSVVGPVRNGGGAAVSSSAIRAALADGDVRTAEAMLGRRYWLTGVVVRGEGRGREIGVPTANLSLHGDKLLPAAGIYAVRAWTGGVAAPGPGGGPYDAVLHVGPRPVFDDARVTVEAHLLDRSVDLYGRVVRLELISRIRDVSDFDSVADLVRAIQGDVTEAKRALADI